ncbi:MAG: hypothetical protein A2750_03070 [Candidatus Yanofskybacteria bacterium RIFCSPHIGHO2_01_FULL_45_42]|uniref:Uncharacterized protein n=3 Tax=Candidatus Yanofskyibacteriota TaxID=1752733 RepID=A0A1F8H231_9BACT|nr:MAG: hypothetical protein A2750_03070 [Candidatus Yanofskybacteria bacterium RIFCSPHIGHO2_01_FULL_45_42]OGN16438.1 MAG: hypothetical protein A3C81_00520 [Candidatus Yanofskybacteria bacterium RIFCSPHIGHO2_02_FULL_46_19]OGN27373.1 MAG: hypothetical protein A3B17_00210 [Candidatus Yanofskybacteria bacterium RIFCSPLOWO2_01_FULL_45_72]OGN31694.1 MAG: hypothetical protein A3J01_02235 [Candidatus Yanofskybacteria bacterium RIFCSPLOWO2_02_FULL_45_18]
MTSIEFLDEFLTKFLVYLIFENKVSCRHSEAGYHITAGGKEIAMIEWEPPKDKEYSKEPVVWLGREKLIGMRYLILAEAAQVIIQQKIDMENDGLKKINEYMLNWHQEEREMRADAALRDIKKKYSELIN